MLPRTSVLTNISLQQCAVTKIEEMTDEASRSRPNVGASSSSQHGQVALDAVDDLDGDETADLSLDNALLADDPLADDQQRTP